MSTTPLHQRSCDEHPKWTTGCDECNKQNRRYMIRRKLIVDKGRRLSTGAEITVERIRQLRAAGHSSVAIGAAAGIHRNYILELSSGRIDWVQLKTFHAIERVYRELRDFPGTDRRAAGYARRQGWQPPPPAPAPAPIPDDFVDEHAVERALLGERVPLTRAEMTAAWQTLERRGFHANEIARRLHVAERTVQRWRDQGAATNRRRDRTA